jgi:hypothetical protein
MGGGATTGGSGSIRGGGAGRQEATQQPAKQERLYERQSRQMGGYTTTSQIRVVPQEVDVQKRWQLDERQRCLLRGGSIATEGSGSIRDKGTSGWEAMQQPAKQERLNKRQSQWMGCHATTNQIRVAQQEVEAL